MNNALDKHLTIEPANDYDAYFEAVCVALHRDVQRWDERYGNSPTEANLFSCIVEKCFDAGMEPHNCAGVILYAFILFARFPAGDSGQSHEVADEHGLTQSDYYDGITYPIG